MLIINIFCDASINIIKKIACGGCYIAIQDTEKDTLIEYDKLLVLQHDATNNSSEILAIWSGIVKILEIREKYPNAVFRLFSDSKISIYGLRDWMKNWIKNMGTGETLISSSGGEVMNQQKFIEIFNMIVENNIRVELYHQRGHVADGRISVDRARLQFIRANKVPPEGLGLSMEYLCQCNAIIDNLTREAVYRYVSDGSMDEYTMVEGISPIYYTIRKNLLPQYIRNINKTSVVSRHDFRGGYNQ